MSLLSPLLYRAPITDRQTQLLASPWVAWFQALDTRVGGPSAPTILELAAVSTALGLRVTALETALTALTLRVAALEAVASAHLGTPTVAAVEAGAGTGATVSVSGTDRAGRITLTTAALADHRSNAEVLRVTFATPYTTAPVVQLMPSNDAAYALREGRWTKHPVSVRVVTADVSTTGFAVSVGVTSLPRDGQMYTWTFVTLGD